MIDETILSVPLLFSSTLSVGLAIITWRMSDLRTKKPFILLLIAIAWLSTTYLLELLSGTMPEMLFWNDLEYISNVFIPPLFLIFTLMFVGRDSAVNRRNLAIIFAVPTLALAMLWTNDFHHSFYTSVAQPSSAYMQTFVPTYGPWFYLLVIFSFLMGAISFYLLLTTYFRSSRYLRQQVDMVLGSCTLPAVAAIIGLLNLTEIPFTFLMILAFAGSMALLFIGAYRYELFSIIPLALDTVVKRMKDGVVVIDNRGHIIHINPSAEKMLDATRGGRKERRSADTLPFLMSVNLEDAISTGRSLEVSIPKDEVDHYYDIQATAMNDQSGARTGVQLIIRDIDEEKRMKDQLLKANTKLSIMSMVVRHDTMNQVGVIHGYSELISSGHLKSEDMARYGDRIKEAVKYIERQFNFATDYQSLGRSDPMWQWMQLVLAKAKTSGASEGLDVHSDLGPLSVLADPMLEKVFTILLNNSRKHGKKAFHINIGYRIDNGSCVVFYEDDGVGIPADVKPAVFDRDFNPHGSMGLYVASQIMVMSGGAIREAGEEGRGARFELIFPEGSWKEEKFDMSSIARSSGQ